MSHARLLAYALQTATTGVCLVVDGGSSALVGFRSPVPRSGNSSRRVMHIIVAALSDCPQSMLPRSIVRARSSRRRQVGGNILY